MYGTPEVVADQIRDYTAGAPCRPCSYGRRSGAWLKRTWLATCRPSARAWRPCSRTDIIVKSLGSLSTAGSDYRRSIAPFRPRAALDAQAPPVSSGCRQPHCIRYFPDRRSLYEAVSDEVIKEIVEAEAQGGAWTTRLRSLIVAQHRILTDVPGIAAVPVRESGQRAGDAVDECDNAGATRGWLRAVPGRPRPHRADFLCRPGILRWQATPRVR